MEAKDMIDARMRARDAAMRLLNRLTTGAAASALIGVGVFGAISAHTIPGTTSSSTSSTSSSNSSSTSSSSGLQASPTPVGSSSSSGVAVSGGS